MLARLILSLTILVLSLLVAWLGSAIRSAIMTVEYSRVDALAEQGDTRAQKLLGILENPYRALSPITFLFNAALIGLALALTWNAFETSRELYPRISEIVLVLVILLLGKLIVDFLATSRSLVLSLFLAAPLAQLNGVAAPFLTFSNWLTRVAKGPRTRKAQPDRVSADDIQIIMAEGEEPRKIELIDPDEREMIAGIIEMGERYASEMMIPRPDVIALEANVTIDYALDVAAAHGHSRLPVYKEDVDHIIGILHVKDLLQALRHPNQVALQDLLRPVHYVPETARADDILRDLLRNRVHMAVVVDEYGGTSGILTIEDVIEEIVGEIRDEYDAAEEAPYTRISETEMLFDGSVSVSEFNQEFGADVPTEASDTIGGLIYTLLGRLPRVNERVRIGSVQLEVSALNGRRIRQVRALKLPPPQTADSQNEEN